jgi:hypothetical protein
LHDFVLVLEVVGQLTFLSKTGYADLEKTAGFKGRVL